MFALGTSVVSEEPPLTVRLAAAVSVSPTVKARAEVAASSLTVWLAIVEIVGASLTAETVTVNDVDVVAVPSLTLTVIVDEPDWFAAGVIVSVRLAPLPPTVMLAFGTNAVLDELVETVKPAAAVSVSPTVNARPEIEPSSLIV